jgi:hypothetical protein
MSSEEKTEVDAVVIGSKQAPKSDQSSNVNVHSNVLLPYVIVGGGYAAVLDHVTLLQSKWGLERIKGREVIHVYQAGGKNPEGDPDPWQRHCPHLMGQWPDLLSLPGFQNQPFYSDNILPPEEKRAWIGPRQRWYKIFLFSNHFAEITQREIKYMMEKFYPRKDGVKWAKPIEGRVDGITAEDSHFVLSLVGTDGKKLTLAAEYVDVCTGPGRMKVMDRHKGDEEQPGRAIRIEDDELWTEYSNVKVDKLDSDQRLMAAELFMHKDMEPQTKKTLCVVGGGALAVSCVERGVEWGFEEILWVPTQGILTGLPAMGRYDHLARSVDNYGTVSTLPLRHSELESSANLIPAYKNVIFSEDHRVGQVVRTGGNKLKVTFRAGRSPRVWSWEGKNPYAPDLQRYNSGSGIDFDYVVVSANSEDELKHLGSPIRLVPGVLQANTTAQKHTTSVLQALFVGEERSKFKGVRACAMGVESKNGKLRMLGPAGLMLLPLFFKQDELGAGSGAAPHLRWVRSLPAQAVVPGNIGITFAAALIANANGFFWKKTNDCVNTAHYEELLDEFGFDIGYNVWLARLVRSTPFTIAEDDYKGMETVVLDPRIKSPAYS